MGFEKGKDPPVAREDAEYPEWLWGLLDTRARDGGKGGEGGEGDAFGE